MLARVFRSRKRPVGRSWRIDETYTRLGAQRKYLYRAVDRLGQTVDFLLTARRDCAAARRFFGKRAVILSITYKFCRELHAEDDICKTCEPAPHDNVAWRRVALASEIAAELG